jgi:hypothetical protein
MRTAWEELDHKGITPVSWGRACTSAQMIFTHILETVFPLFTYAHNSWKLKLLTSITYPGFICCQRKRQTLKSEHSSSSESLKVEQGTSQDRDGDSQDISMMHRKHTHKGKAADMERPLCKKRKGRFCTTQVPLLSTDPHRDRTYYWN